MRKKWTNELIKSELIKSMEILNLERMPTGGELKSIGRNDLHCKVSRTKKYSGWADELGVKLKSSTTTEGNKKEKSMKNTLIKMGYEVEIMGSRHPYDLLVNKSVKIDVKLANPYLLKGKSRVHTFSLNKVKPTCDIYILVAADENKLIERTLVIPSHHIQMKMVNIGKDSKYNKYNNRFDYIRYYSDFFGSI